MAGQQIDSIIFPPFDVALGAFSFEEDESEGDDEGTGFTVARR